MNAWVRLREIDIWAGLNGWKSLTAIQVDHS